jgi:hypothetical protein
MIPKCSRLPLAFGGDEIAHFLECVDFAGNGIEAPGAPVSDGGLTSPDFFTNPPVQPVSLLEFNGALRRRQRALFALAGEETTDGKAHDRSH